jgi:hypothetical protein
MTAAALILYGAAFVCFLAVAGDAAWRINPLGLGLACCALLWFLQVLVPHVA